MNPELIQQAGKRLPPGRRRPVALSQQGLVKTDYLEGDSRLPLVIQPRVDGVNLAAWAGASREFIEAQLLQHGALLFQNFKVNTLGEFEKFVRAVCGDMMEYRERSSPRSQMGERVYTSTDYPEDQSIFPHNEHSYSRTFPTKLFFSCITAAESGGETPLADTRRVLARINPQIRKRFVEKNWMLVRNYGHGLGLPWQTVFRTTERAVVEQYCRREGIETMWLDGDRLRTRQVRPVGISHQRTGEWTWFNHATFFHVSTLAPSIREALLSEFTEEELPNNSYYGDGTAIEPDVLEELREAYRQAAVSFPWQAGSVILLDNILTAHARNPFTGPRKILFAMADPFTRTDYAIDRA
ncbi:MAG TPA: TauD/TfdA family dioxygenase [Pyrinomonadaceae bacterium]